MLVDVHERGSGVPRALEALGVPFLVRSLGVGDYAFRASHIERKTVVDLHLSVRNGRLWPQLWRMLDAGGRAYLLVEGTRLEAGPLGGRAVRAALLTAASRGITLLRSECPADSAQWICAVIAREQERWRPTRPGTQKGRSRVAAQRAAEVALTAVPGIAPITARNLLAHFGSLAAISAASQDDLLEVVGVGPARAAALEQTFHPTVRDRPAAGG